MSQISPSTPTQAGRISTVREHKFHLLFLFLLAYLVFYPYIQNSGLEYLAFRVFGVSVTLLSIYAVSFRRSFVFVALVLAIPALAQRLLLPRGDQGTLALLIILFSFAFDLFIVVVIFRRVFARHVPNAETIFGALCIYLLLGFSFASLYHMLATVQARAFYLDPVSNIHQVPNRFDLIYYSFGTMTSLGAAGMTPVSDPARSLSVIEAILGILYLAVLISKLMSAYQTDRGA
ncbi:MAG: hypothetical protein JO182_32595 [Acidobacteriaceae bacterium]|nr:hypothetical protein [Acidobacteriaceae bacterium]MBV9039267.1 hypothetical protein [Acidobacteriaceae bacterium]MBV9222420.1 hypothetical protein [Acidobacteriaceae bacterium]MBV9305217.1 hypothetical protein [Acidobacteriaceae bacterium]MBV9676563.1 hypothetical protein [Acidobacteriaceae bacterium]